MFDMRTMSKVAAFLSIVLALTAPQLVHAADTYYFDGYEFGCFMPEEENGIKGLKWIRAGMLGGWSTSTPEECRAEVRRQMASCNSFMTSKPVIQQERFRKCTTGYDSMVPGCVAHFKRQMSKCDAPDPDGEETHNPWGTFERDDEVKAWKWKRAMQALEDAMKIGAEAQKKAEEIERDREQRRNERLQSPSSPAVGAPAGRRTEDPAAVETERKWQALANIVADIEADRKAAGATDRLRSPSSPAVGAPAARKKEDSPAVGAPAARKKEDSAAAGAAERSRTPSAPTVGTAIARRAAEPPATGATGRPQAPSAPAVGAPAAQGRPEAPDLPAPSSPPDATGRPQIPSAPAVGAPAAGTTAEQEEQRWETELRERQEIGQKLAEKRKKSEEEMARMARESRDWARDRARRARRERGESTDFVDLSEDIDNLFHAPRPGVPEPPASPTPRPVLPAPPPGDTSVINLGDCFQTPVCDQAAARIESRQASLQAGKNLATMSGTALSEHMAALAAISLEEMPVCWASDPRPHCASEGARALQSFRKQREEALNSARQWSGG